MQVKCPFYPQCGGCDNMDVDYQQQLAKKQELLETLHHQDVPMRGQDDPYAYRNRMDFVCTPQGIGLRKAGEWDQVVDITHCVIANDAINQALATIRVWVQDHGIECYDLSAHTGWLRYVVIRAQEQLQVAITTNGTGHEQAVQDLYERLDAQSLVWTIEQSKSNTSLGDEVHETYGQDTITLSLAGREFLIDPYTFFQTSPQMASKAIAVMREFVPDDTTVHDLYCGVGTLGQCLADRVVGVESVPESVERARANARTNGVEAEYHCADAGAWLLGHDPQLVIVDPPRAGLKTGAQQLLAAKPDTIIYLSCNPKSQKSDLVRLKQGYDVVHLEGFDFFAHSDHVECLAVLKRRD